MKNEFLHDPVSRSHTLTELVVDLQVVLSGMDRRLGYRGKDRFVAFYHEPRALEVIWRDRHSGGFATGGWIKFMDEVAPVASHYGVNIGCDGTAATHVLFLDRSAGKTYFAERTTIVQFLSRIAHEQPHAAWDATLEADVSDGLIEITLDEVVNLARKLWEEKTAPVYDSPSWINGLAATGISIASAIHFP